MGPAGPWRSTREAGDGAPLILKLMTLPEIEGAERSEAEWFRIVWTLSCNGDRAYAVLLMQQILDIWE